MKSKLMLVVTLISILVMVVGVAAVPAKVAGVTLVETKFQPGKGVVFKFEVVGDKLDKQGYTGAVYYSGNEYRLSCKWNGEIELLVCNAGDALIQLKGKSVTGNINGYPFSAVVPEKRESCRGWAFQTEEGYYYIWDNADVGEGLVYDYYGETVIPETLQCSHSSWTANENDGENYWYEVYVGP